jgi:hypothetical protein
MNVLRILAQVPVPPTRLLRCVVKQDSVTEYYTMPSEVVSPRHDLEDNSNPSLVRMDGKTRKTTANYILGGFIKLWISSSVF